MYTAEDFLYPREGTETCILGVCCKLSEGDFLYPREGTETRRGSPIQRISSDFLYPREGTETFASLTLQYPTHT